MKALEPPRDIEKVGRLRCSKRCPGAVRETTISGFGCLAQTVCALCGRVQKSWKRGPPSAGHRWPPDSQTPKNPCTHRAWGCGGVQNRGQTGEKEPSVKYIRMVFRAASCAVWPDRTRCERNAANGRGTEERNQRDEMCVDETGLAISLVPPAGRTEVAVEAATGKGHSTRVQRSAFEPGGSVRCY